jgi:ribonuclease Z
MYTHTLLGSPYVVHELRLPSDPSPSVDGCPLPLHTSELASGRNLIQEIDGTWRDIMSHAPHPNISISAAPIQHSCPCVGYVLQESPRPGKITDPKVYMDRIKAAGGHPSLMRDLQLGQSVTLPDGTMLDGPPRRPGRKVAILGDTFDPSPIVDLAQGADLLVHEATNAHLPGIDPVTKAEDTFESVEERTKSRGHSTPQMAGAFAKRINAKALVLNHFSARYKGDRDPSPDTEMSEGDIQAAKIMSGIRALAIETFGSERVTCARDFMDVDVSLPDESHKLA